MTSIQNCTLPLIFANCSISRHLDALAYLLYCITQRQSLHESDAADLLSLLVQFARDAFGYTSRYRSTIYLLTLTFVDVILKILNTPDSRRANRESLVSAINRVLSHNSL